MAGPGAGRYTGRMAVPSVTLPDLLLHSWVLFSLHQREVLGAPPLPELGQELDLPLVYAALRALHGRAEGLGLLVGVEPRLVDALTSAALDLAAALLRRVDALGERCLEDPAQEELLEEALPKSGANYHAFCNFIAAAEARRPRHDRRRIIGPRITGG